MKFEYRKSDVGKPAVEFDGTTIDVGCVTVADGDDDGECDDDECDGGGGVRADADAATAADKNPADNCGDH